MSVAKLHTSVKKSSSVHKRIKHHFLPNKELKKRAKLLYHAFLFSYSLFVIPLIIVFKTLPKMAPGVLGYSSQISSEDLITHTNQIRERNNVSSLKENPKLTKAAQKKAEDMFKEGYWAHVSPKGVEPWSFIVNEKYDYIYAGENLAKNFASSEEVVEAWFKSPSHKENLLNPKFQDVGFAVQSGVLDGYETTLVVQMFGRLRNAPDVAPKTVNQPMLTDAKQITAPAENTAKQVKPAMDVFEASKTSYTMFVLYILLLLLFDIAYSRKHQLKKNSGHTLAHALFLSFTALALWTIFSPGKVI